MNLILVIESLFFNFFSMDTIEKADHGALSAIKDNNSINMVC